MKIASQKCQNIVKTFLFKEHAQRRRDRTQLKAGKHHGDKFAAGCDLISHHAPFADAVLIQDSRHLIGIPVHFLICIASAEIIYDKFPVSEFFNRSLEPGEQRIVCPVSALLVEFL